MLKPPMSSPQIIRMLGFFVPCATVGETVANAVVAVAAKMKVLKIFANRIRDLPK